MTPFFLFPAREAQKAALPKRSQRPEKLFKQRKTVSYAMSITKEKNFVGKEKNPSVSGYRKPLSSYKGK